MTSLGRLALVANLAMAALIAIPVPAQACGCAPVAELPPELARPVSFDREIAIFTATVVEGSLLKATITLDVHDVWKGEMPPQVTMNILSGNSCEFSFELGKTYLIFGVGDSIWTMRAEKCTATAPIEDAGRALELLKKAGYSPRRPRL